MKKSRFTEEQIIAILREQEQGMGELFRISIQIGANSSIRKVPVDCLDPRLR